MSEQAKDPTGCWVAYYSDRSGAAVFPSEIEALRYAAKSWAEVAFRKWGSDVYTGDRS